MGSLWYDLPPLCGFLMGKAEVGSRPAGPGHLSFSRTIISWSSLPLPSQQTRKQEWWIKCRVQWYHGLLAVRAGFLSTSMSREPISWFLSEKLWKSSIQGQTIGLFFFVVNQCRGYSHEL